jgi:hypothetical protein
MTETRPKRMSPERCALLATLVEDEWPISQMILTHGFRHSTVRKYHPDYRGMSPRERGEIGLAAKTANAAMKKHRP